MIFDGFEVDVGNVGDNVVILVEGVECCCVDVFVGFV